VRDFGVTSGQFDIIAQQVVSQPFDNLHLLDQFAARKLLQDVWEGSQPDY